MELSTIVSKRAYLFSLIYDLFHVPSLQGNGHLHLFNMGDFSKALYLGYILERRKLWVQAIHEIIGAGSSGDIRELMEALDSIDVYGWEFIEGELGVLANKAMGVYNEYRDKVIREVSRILGIREYYRKIYLIIGFNPLKGVYGSLVYGGDPGYAVASVLVRPDINPIEVVDLLLHEVLHGLIRINNIRIPDELEEEFIDTLCPDGFLSNLLGLSRDLVVRDGRLQHLMREYFNQKLYSAGIKLPDFIQQSMGER